MTRHNRRDFLQASGAAITAAALMAAAREGAAAPKSDKDENSKLAGELGIVSASAGIQLAGRGKDRNFSLLELPRIMRDELDLRVIDLNTSSFPSFAKVDRAYLDRLRKAADDAGCVMTNLKMNQRDIDMNSRDKNLRQKALAEYKRSIDIASQLGCRWARPLPRAEKPDLDLHVASYQQLCEYGAKRNVKMLVENFGWMQSDPESVVKLVNAIGDNVAAGPDTGNWNSNEIRYKGLASTFPIAVTCDFKARKLGPDGQHALYDLNRCFRIGWEAGFRGPWCFEHANADTKLLFKELGMLRDMIRKWTAAAKQE